MRYFRLQMKKEDSVKSSLISQKKSELFEWKPSVIQVGDLISQLSYPGNQLKNLMTQVRNPVNRPENQSKQGREPK